MGRRPNWPPRVTVHRGRERVRFRGKEYALGAAGSDEARQAYARLLAELAAGGAGAAEKCRRDGAGPAVAEAVAAWLTAELPRYGTSGEPAHFRRALTVLVRLYGDLPCRDFRARQLDAVRLSMASGTWMTDDERAEATARGGQIGWCRNHVNRQTSRLRTVWRWAERQGWAPEGSWAHLRTLPGLAPGDARVRATQRRRAATWEDVQKVAAEAPPTVRAILLVQWHSGMRSGEARTMRLGELDRSDPTVWLYRPARHKTAHLGQSRVVALGPQAQAVLAPFVAAAISPDGYLFGPADGKPGRGACYTCTSYAQAVRRAAQRAGVAGFSPYRCRHAYKQRVTAALGLDAARSALGQASIGTTNLYGEAVDVAAAMEAARRLG